MGYLAELINDADTDVSINAAYAAGICVARGADSLKVQSNLINMLHSENDMAVETAIEAIGECAKNPNYLGRKALLNKLKAMGKNGVPSATKADAGFALAEAISCAEDIISDRNLRRELVSAFSALLMSKDKICNIAGITGFGAMAIAASKQQDAKIPEPKIFISDIIRFLGPALETSVILDVIRICRLERGYPIPVELLNKAALDMVMTSDEWLLGQASSVLKHALYDPDTRLKMVNLVAPWGIMTNRILSMHERGEQSLSEWQVHMVIMKKELIESLIEKSVALSKAEGKQMCLAVPK